MSKKLFNPEMVPMYPQTEHGGNINYQSDEIVSPANPYVMRTRMITKSGASGPWGAVQLPAYQTQPVFTSGEAVPTQDSWVNTTIGNQKSSLTVSTQSTFADGSTLRTYASAITVNLVEQQRFAVTGVNVWFRWMPLVMFVADPTTDAPAQQQKDGGSYVPDEWTLIGSYQSSSFTTAIPRSTDMSTNKWFQILVTDRTTVSPNRFNYRWMGATTATHPAGYTHSNVGERYGTTAPWVAGYLPWNPYLGAGKGQPWTTYARQRTTLQDIAIFYPRKWII